MSSTPFKLLYSLNTIEDLRRLDRQSLVELCKELRLFVQTKTKTKAAHIKSSLGVTELSVAIHYLFNTPSDKLIWDVGHQAYIHKVLTDRRDLFETNRQYKGLSAFPSIFESPFDSFTVGHSSTSISAAAGFAIAQSDRNNTETIAVIGDGALTGGMSFEALNFIGERNLDVLVILNKNKISIDDNVGFLNKESSYQKYFESLGWTILSQINGNDLNELLPALEEAKNTKGPRVIIANTTHGLGYADQEKEIESNISYQSAFANYLDKAMTKDNEIHFISPAMISGAGIRQKTRNKFPERIIDVGIAEQHAVSMSAAMALSNKKPICHLYSTFAQRALDQIIHDVALQELNLCFLIDRAGLVGEDGPTHHGLFDISFLSPIPNIEIFQPASEADLALCFQTALESAMPSFIRVPKSNISNEFSGLEARDDYRWLKQNSSKKLLISYGRIGLNIMTADSNDTDFDHLQLIRLKPLDFNFFQEVCATYSSVLIIEEAMEIGGIGQQIKSSISHPDIQLAGIKNAFIPGGKLSELFKHSGLDGESLKRKLKNS